MTASPRRTGLSKSRLTAFEQCPRRLWLSVHRPDLGETDADAEARFATGHRVGEVACGLHPEGVMVEAVPDLSAALATTARLLAEGHRAPIFEATFQHDGVLVRADLLLPHGRNGWRMAEVKSAASVKDYHLGDLATQVWVAEACGLNLTSAGIAHIDTAFVLAREGDYDGLFAHAELLPQMRERAQGRPAVVAAARAVLAGEEPQREPGDHCSTPFDCEFAAHCSRHLPPGPDWPVTVLPYGGGKAWLERGVDDLLALETKGLKPLQARIVEATRDDRPFHDVPGARRAMAGWPRPHAFLDFETIAPAVPRWLGTRPYQQVPFQFSLHIEHEDGAEVAHRGFLQVDGGDPRRPCAEALVAHVPPTGAIIAYNAGFERGVLRALAQAVPEHAAALEDMAARTVDLLPVARNHWYHRDQRGSWSIKAVLPTIAAELGYEGLEVKDGGAAQEAFLEASAPDCDPDRRWVLEEGLKAYCERDTWAMVVVMRRLMGDA
ncbi:DUF2779 domain-containing protein [Novosphingobium sp. KCTC 2891]|uniref:DUF2779 domain-containing protein n=1 Tax=Novosphingobium sp. KCTC 2891 TaxID=2989730 RepID=UPI0022231ED1|nr:DUF2779 domain-containing protein [Novosphingobium sp. KCTC 2891]MCW1385068.1 DUF2779 domain-containing protein [Novosphingobium sp. KCTC 2891]